MFLRPRHYLLIAALALVGFAFGMWLSSFKVTAALAGLDKLEPVLPALKQRQLSLHDLRARLPGELYVEASLEGAVLTWHSEWEADEQTWQLVAELALSAEERQSLAKASGVTRGKPAEPLSAALADQLGSHLVQAINLRGEPEPHQEALEGSFGRAKLKLPLEGEEAWVYPKEGLTARVGDEAVRLLRFVAPNDLNP